jgi:hypothetical protein
MYECMNRNCDEFWEFGRKNHEKRSLESWDMGSESFRGQTDFLGGPGATLEFLECLKGFGAKDMGSLKFGDFQGFWWNFGGFKVVSDLFINIFQNR